MLCSAKLRVQDVSTTLKQREVVLYNVHLAIRAHNHCLERVDVVPAFHIQQAADEKAALPCEQALQSVTAIILHDDSIYTSYLPNKLVFWLAEDATLDFFFAEH